MRRAGIVRGVPESGQMQSNLPEKQQRRALSIRETAQVLRSIPRDDLSI